MSENPQESLHKSTAIPPWVKLALDLGPLAVFFISFRLGGLLAATAGLMAATLVALGITYWLEKKLAMMPLITAGVVGVFGGLTLFLHDELFIKMKPTIVNIIFAAILLGGCALKRPLLKPLLGSAIAMTETGWMKLSCRWGIFFLFLAALNEYIWRNYPTEFWVNFKVFGMFTCTIVFTLSQIPLMKREMTNPD